MRAFASCGLPAPTRERSLSIVGLSLAEAFTALVGPRGPIDELAEAYKAVFSVLRADPSWEEPLFPGARAIIERLSARPDVRLGIATGKSRRGVAHLVERESWERVFDTIQTADDAPSKPDPGMLLRALEATGCRPEHAAMIGDTTFDMGMAQAAGLRGIGVAWGYHPVAALREAGADHLVSTFEEVDALLPVASERADA